MGLQIDRSLDRPARRGSGGGLPPARRRPGRRRRIGVLYCYSQGESTTGTTISNACSIVFDVNSPIVTNTFVNTIDAGPPTSRVAALPATSPANFTVTWSGHDDAGGSGIANYSVYVSNNGGAFTVWQWATTLTSAAFTGVAGHTYAFWCMATDNVGHQEVRPFAVDTQTTVQPSVPPTFTLTGPTSGTFVPGQPITIQWTAANMAPGSTVSLCCDKDATWWNGNECWIEIDQATAAGGSFTWNTAAVKPGTYYIAGYLWSNGTPTFFHLTRSITILCRRLL